MFVNFIIAMVVSVIAILIAVILGDYGPWYLSWVLGTGFMVLVAASAGVLFEAQEDSRAAGAGTDAAKALAGAGGGAAKPGAAKAGATKSSTGKAGRSGR